MATTDMQRLIVSLEAQTKKFENALNKANGVANKRARAIESRFERMNKRVSGGFTSLSAKIAGAFAAAQTLRGAKDLVDSATRIDNALKVAGLSGAALETVYNALFISASRNAAPLETLVTLYGKAALVQKELGVTTQELLGFTDNVALALRVAGADAQSASGALLQLSQALGSGVVRAEEFNSILEGAPTIAQAAAAGLEEAGGSVAKLRKLVIDGKVSSEAFFRAFEAGAPTLQEKVSDAVFTIDQRLTNLRTALVNAARRFNTSTNAANTFGEAIDNVADYVNDVNFDELIGQIAKVIEAFRQGIRWAGNFSNSVSEITGLERVGEMLTGGAVQRSFLGGALTVTSSRALRERIDSAFEQQIQTAGELTEQAIRDSVLGGRLPRRPQNTANDGGFSPIEPVALSEFDPPSSSGSSGSRRSRQNAWQREVAQIEARTDALHGETTAMAELNPLINDYGFAVERARTVHELLTAAQEAGMEVTPRLYDQIESLATAYATASVEAEKLAESQDKARQTAEEINDLGKDVLGGFISDLRNGVSAAEALENALNKVIDKILEMTLSNIFGGGGLLSLFGFADGGIAAGGMPRPLPRYARGGVSRTAAIFGEAGPEAAVPLPDGRRIPVDLRMPGAPPSAGRAGGATITINAPINAPGADPAALARVEKSVRDLSKSIPRRVDERVNARQVRKTRP